MASAIKRTILVTGATGKQGRGFIEAAVSTTDDIWILAVTRNAASASAKSLDTISDRVRVVEADLDKPESVRKVFQDASAEGGIWGAFIVLAFPGLGADASGEEKQGILLADLALEFKVQHFIYSSSERGGEGEGENDIQKLDRLAKIHIELHVKSLEGLRWTILRPAFFMENFDGFIGTITTTVLRCGLGEDTKVQLIAADDIGGITLAVFQASDQHVNDVVVVEGDHLSPKELNEAYIRATGKPLPSVPDFIGRALLAINKHTKDLCADLDRVYAARLALPEKSEDLIRRCRTLYPGMQSFETWAKNRGARAERAKGWNKVSIWGLIRGKQ